MIERLDQRFASARPQSEKDGWKAAYQRRAVGRADLRPAGLPVRPVQGPVQVAQVHRADAGAGSIDDLVGMDDIKAEVAQIKDQYQRRAEYAEYGISSPSM